MADKAADQFKLFPPAPAKTQVNNAAWLVDHGPYQDDCWMYGWGCAPPGYAGGVVVRGPNPNPARPVFVREAAPQASAHHGRRHRRPAIHKG
jgi:hypothetical protein